MATQASHMLEAALERMDDIIAGSGSLGGQPEVLRLAEELSFALEAQPSMEQRDTLRKRVPESTARTLKDWLHVCTVNHSPPVSSDRASLVLQVSVLTDQVEAQGEKIRDLESSLGEHQHKLTSTEKMLQQELHSRTLLESQKLDLMEEVSFLKLKLEGMEEEQRGSNSKQHNAKVLQQQLQLLKEKVEELEAEKSQCERKLWATKAEVSRLQQLLADKDVEIQGLQSKLLCRSSWSSKAKGTDEEFERLKIGMEALLAANDKKDRFIEELTALLRTYGKNKVVSLAQGQGDTTVTGSSEEDLSGTRGTWVLPAKQSPSSTSSSSRHAYPQEEQDLGSRSSPVTPGKISLQNCIRWVQPRILSSSLDKLQSGSSPKHMAGESIQPVLSTESHQADGKKCQTLPGRLSPPEYPGGGAESLSSAPSMKEWNMSCKELGDVTSDLASVTSSLDLGRQSPVDYSSSLKRLWGRIRRTQSGTLPSEDPEPALLRRGGLRATAGPRLLGSSVTLCSDQVKDVPFAQWSPEQVSKWLDDVGLGQYRTMASHWVKSGQTLLSATPHDLEKELGLKHPLHRKKLQLALLSLSYPAAERSSELDHTWVTRWLDDIGLPQYKDQFSESRVDGRMLQYLTVNDLLFLKVTSQLHHLSIRWAIRVLHANKFDPHCLKRRPSDETQTHPSEVVQWSNHRVMEWLRTVDLAEYAPNLRGSGVHGGLIVLEPQFNSDTLAALLNIPPQKTLLRRHLATSFASLVGPHAQRQKQDFLEGSDHTPLTATTKVRPKKLVFPTFGNLGKKKFDEGIHYICPPDLPPLALNGAPRGQSPLMDRGAGRPEQDQTPQLTEVKKSTVQSRALSQRTSTLSVAKERPCWTPNGGANKNTVVLCIKETTL
ncbi:liprin-beta-2-like isoform X3 [Brienomyrus brachyistius]|uniref:liprin-beta-2-like isoform X3 n=1 Tax=Brienomyrus brachyistius TaxID=42636 RepID=UPI0020B1CA7D|nr:liprin-beta-2-like isoform X3 [Brienomyrus brachyistius]